MEATGLNTNQDMIVTGLEAKDAESAIRKLCALAMKMQYIEPVFITALLEREKVYPTGLPTGIPIAIPHIHEGCLKSFFSMAVTKEPVAFGCMGEPNEKIETRLIFLFGITDPSRQTEVLKKFCNIFQNDKVMKELLLVSDRQALLKRMKELLGDYLTIEDKGEEIK